MLVAALLSGPAVAQNIPPPTQNVYVTPNPNAPLVVTTTPAATVPHAYTALVSASVTTSSAALYTYGTPTAVLNLTNSGSSTVWLGVKGTAGGACDAAVVGTGIPIYGNGGGYLFGTAVPLPTCAITAIAESGTDNVAEAGY
jgi:hypothetical protein